MSSHGRKDGWTAGAVTPYCLRSCRIEGSSPRTACRQERVACRPATVLMCHGVSIGGLAKDAGKFARFAHKVGAFLRIEKVRCCGFGFYLVIRGGALWSVQFRPQTWSSEDWLRGRRNSWLGRGSSCDLHPRVWLSRFHRRRRLGKLYRRFL